MKKSELTNGMHVITKGDEEFIVIDNVVADKQIEDGKICNVILVNIDGSGWLGLDNYDENLNELDGSYDFEIAEIYKANGWEMGMFYVDDATAEFRNIMEIEETHEFKY